jgi:drug/metabolite transporter (DMT)-like permease
MKAGALPSIDRPLYGIFFMCLSMLLFVVMDLFSRYLTQIYTIQQLMWIRFWIFLLFAAFLIGPKNLRRALVSRRPRFQIVRALTMVLEIGSFTVAFRFLPVADVHSVAAATPLIVLALSGPILKERVSRAQWWAVLVGFAAVIVILQPGFKVIEWFHLLPVLAAVMWAIYQVQLRIVGRLDSPQTTLLYTSIIGFVVSTVFGMIGWQWPDLEGWALIIAAGFTGCGAHYALMVALSFSPAPALQPYGYTTVLWAVILGLLIFGEFPDAWTLGGATVLVCVGIYSMTLANRSN